MTSSEGLQLLVVTTLSCAHAAPPEPFPAAAAWHLGESTASPGSDPTLHAALEPDDPRTIDVSRPIRRLPDAADVNLEGPIHIGRYMSRSDRATSSTPVYQGRDIAPVSTTEVYDQPGVFSPPPPPNGYR